MKILVLLFSMSLFADTYQKDSISVNGECTEKINPDRIRIEFNVEITEKKQQQSTLKANQIYNRLKAGVKKINPKDLELNTSSYNVHPTYDYNNRKRKLIGYKTNIGLTVISSEMEKSGDIINVGNITGVNNIQGPNPFVSLKTYQTQYKKCLAQAALDATSKAKMLASTLNVTLGKAIKVNETNHNSYQYQRPQRMMMRAKTMSMDAEAGSAPSIEFGKQSLNVKLNVQFAIR